MTLPNGLKQLPDQGSREGQLASENQKVRKIIWLSNLNGACTPHVMLCHRGQLWIWLRVAVEARHNAVGKEKIAEQGRQEHVLAEQALEGVWRHRPTQKDKTHCSCSTTRDEFHLNMISCLSLPFCDLLYIANCWLSNIVFRTACQEWETCETWWQERKTSNQEAQKSLETRTISCWVYCCWLGKTMEHGTDLWEARSKRLYQWWPWKSNLSPQWESSCPASEKSLITM